MQFNNFVGQLLKSMLVMIQLDTHAMQLRNLQIENCVNPPSCPKYLSKQNALNKHKSLKDLTVEIKSAS